MKRVLLILLLLALPLASAQLEDPREISSASMKFTTTGNLNMEGNVKHLYLKLYAFPKTEYYSIVSAIDTNPPAELKTDELRPYYYYIWNPTLERDADTYKQKLAERQVDYSFSARVDARFILLKITEKQEFPYPPLDRKIKPYSKATSKVDSDDPKIKQLANTLASGETDAYKVAFKFAKYVNEIITYDTDFLDSTQKASWVLENKRGVCDEYTVLFMALSRSVGIPVRYVAGVAFSNLENKFVPHSWAEVYINDAWIPFDPTYNEYGWVDATHIRMQDTIDAEVSAIKYIWEVGDVEGGQPDIKVDIHEKEKALPNYLTTKMWIEKHRIGFGSYNIIWMKIDNPTSSYIIPEVYLSKSPQVIGDNRQHIFLEPHDSALVYWIVKISSDLNEKYTYSYSIETSMMFADSKKISFIADPDEEVLTLADINQKLSTNITETSAAQPGIKININKPEVARIGEPFEVEISAANKGNIAVPNLKICIDDCQVSYLGISEEITRTFEVVRNMEGEHKIEITFEGEGIDLAQEITVSIRKSNFFDIILDWFRK